MGVTVIPMNTDEVLQDQVVTVSDGVIVSVDSVRRGRMPPGALVLEGGFLIPGLCDMHTHLHRRDPDPEHLVLYLAEGVTTVRALSGPSENHEWRTMIEAGRLIGPTILSSGRVLIDGLPPEVLSREPVYVPTSAEDAAAEVWRQAESWPDLIKVYDGLAADAYLGCDRRGQLSRRVGGRARTGRSHRRRPVGLGHQRDSPC